MKWRQTRKNEYTQKLISFLQERENIQSRIYIWIIRIESFSWSNTGIQEGTSFWRSIEHPTHVQRLRSTVQSAIAGSRNHKSESVFSRSEIQREKGKFESISNVNRSTNMMLNYLFVAFVLAIGVCDCAKFRKHSFASIHWNKNIFADRKGGGDAAYFTRFGLTFSCDLWTLFWPVLLFVSAPKFCFCRISYIFRLVVRENFNWRSTSHKVVPVNNDHFKSVVGQSRFREDGRRYKRRSKNLNFITISSQNRWINCLCIQINAKGVEQIRNWFVFRFRLVQNGLWE